MDIDYIQEECLKWICDNNFGRIIIQFREEDLNNSLQVVEHLKNAAKGIIDRHLQIYVTQSNSCCIDLLVTQHVSDIDGIIHIGNVCVSKPEINCDEIRKPVLFVFGKPQLSCKQLETNVDTILGLIESIVIDRAGGRICVLYDANQITYATNIESRIQKSHLKDHVEVAGLYCPLANWHTTSDNEQKFVKNQVGVANRLGYFFLSQAIDQYDCAIYLGKNVSIKLALKGPRELWKINENESNIFIKEKINLTRLLNKRIALVDRLKDEEELKIGVIITNPLPDIEQVVTEFELYAKARKHILYFISMIQTTDEYKIGNFDLCDAFVIINSCSCSALLESLVFNRPLLTDLEFKLACGFEAEYGRVLWPGSSSHLSYDDLIIKRKVSEVSLALTHTRNELLERCSRARVNKWSGLSCKATLDEGGTESLDIEEGLTGIASSYTSEPLKRPEHDNDKMSEN